ncbi:MAG: hypothetical protein ACTSRZ_14395, partial [Promethearchaeota archaeon]
GFIKVHLAVEVSTHVPVAVIVTDEKVGDSKELIPLIEMKKETKKRPSKKMKLMYKFISSYLQTM